MTTSDPEPPDTPAPTLQVGYGVVRATSRGGHKRIRFNPSESWEVRWLEFEWHMRSLESEYLADPEFVPDTRPLQMLVEATIGSCWDVGDWVRRSTHFDKDVREFKTVKPLSYCGDYINTVKHLRRWEGSAVGRLLTYEVRPMRLWITFTGTTDEEGMEQLAEDRDALELARECRGAWLMFLEHHGLVPPLT